ncbi:MAG: gamma-butyrobetaine hydroxylase-like domain-containing protein [Phycisphaerales bacterium JB060]
MNREPAPTSLDLDRQKGLTVHWQDGRESFYPLAYLRRMSPSADMRQLREEMQTNPLVVVPDSGSSSELRAVDAQLVGRYAIRVTFSDGHRTGIFSWDYLRSIDPDARDGEDSSA